MLWQRVLTASLLAPLALIAVLYLPNAYFALACAILLLLAAWEWAGLAGLDQLQARLAYVGVIAFSMAVAAGLHIGYAVSATWVVVLASLWWCAVAVGLALTRTVKVRTQSGPRTGHAVYGWLTIIPAWASLVSIHGLSAQGPRLLVYLLILIWVADIAAFFVGRRFGRRKLAPVISPGKTWAGVLGALAGAFACGVFIAQVRELPVFYALAFISLGLVTVGFSIVGDLFESLMKRRCGLKDSGTLLPGHGGLLDRVDSLMAAAPVFAAGLILLGLA